MSPDCSRRGAVILWQLDFGHAQFADVAHLLPGVDDDHRLAVEDDLPIADLAWQPQAQMAADAAVDAAMQPNEATRAATTDAHGSFPPALLPYS